MLALASFLFFTSLVGLVTYFLTRRDDHDSATGYFLAGRTLTGGDIAGSLLLTNLSTEQLVGLNGLAFKNGLSVMAWEVIAAASLVVLALIFLPKYLRSGIATVPQFLEQRFDSGTRNLTTAIFLLAYVGILLPTILYTGATGLTQILDMESMTGIQDYSALIWVTVWLIGLVGSVYAIFGGLRTVAVSDTLNGLGLLLGGMLITWYGLQAVNSEGALAALETLKEQYPEKFNSLGGPKDSVPFSTLFSGVLLINLFYWTTNQQIIQRTFGAKNLAEGQKGVLIAGIFKILAPAILVLPGIIAFHLYQTGQIDGAGDLSYGALVHYVLPPSLTGFFAAVIFGSILSTFNSVLNSSSTLFSLGVYKELIHPAATEEQVIRAGKRFGWIVAIMSMSVAPLLIGQSSIFDYLQKMNGLYFIPILSVVVIGITTRRVPPLAAKLALVVGCCGIAVGYFVPAANKLISGIHEYHFLAMVFVGLIAMMLAIGRVRPLSQPWQAPEATHELDLTPWRPAWPLGIGLLAIVLAIYVWFADPSVLTDAAATEVTPQTVMAPGGEAGFVIGH